MPGADRIIEMLYGECLGKKVKYVLKKINGAITLAVVKVASAMALFVCLWENL